MSKPNAKPIPRTPNANGARFYVRNSGRDEKDVLKPESQLHHCNIVADRLTAYLIQTYDEGDGLHSAFKRTNLDQFDDMIRDAIADAGTKFIITYDSARLLRNVEVANTVLKQLERHGIQWHTYAIGQLSLDIEELRLKTQVQFVMDEEESRRTTRRLKENHYEPARREGLYYSHTAPLGLTRSGSVKNRTLTWTPNEDFPTILLICQLYSQGNIGSGTIALELENRGITWIGRKGLRRVSRISYRTIANTITKMERYAPFLPTDLYQRFLEARTKRKARQSNRRQVHPTLKLRGLVYCAGCDTKLVSSTMPVDSRGHRYWYQVYSHPMPVRCDNPPFTLRAPRIEAKVWELMKEKQAYVDANREEIIEQALDDADSSQRTRHEADPGPDYAVQREEYNQQIGRLTREWLTAGLSPEEYRALRLDLETKRDAIPTADAEYSLGNCRQKQDAPNRELIELAVDAFIGMLAYERENSELLNQTLHRYIERIEVKGYDHVEIVWSAPFDSGVVI